MDILGNYRKIVLVKSLTDFEMPGALLEFGLKEGLIDGALTVQFDEEWKPRPIIATKVEELRQKMRTHWAIYPMDIEMLKDMHLKMLERLAVVCKPCQAQGLRNMIDYPFYQDEFARRIKLIIGTFCMGTISEDSYRSKIERELNIRVQDIERTYLRPDGFHVELKNGTVHTLPTSWYMENLQRGCLTCDDFTSRSSDISVGYLGMEFDIRSKVESDNPEDFGTLIIRTEMGEDFINMGVEKGYFEVRPISDAGIAEIRKYADYKAELVERHRKE